MHVPEGLPPSTVALSTSCLRRHQASLRSKALVRDDHLRHDQRNGAPACMHVVKRGSDDAACREGRFAAHKPAPPTVAARIVNASGDGSSLLSSLLSSTPAGLPRACLRPPHVANITARGESDWRPTKENSGLNSAMQRPLRLKGHAQATTREHAEHRWRAGAARNPPQTTPRHILRCQPGSPALAWRGPRTSTAPHESEPERELA